MTTPRRVPGAFAAVWLLAAALLAVVAACTETTHTPATPRNALPSLLVSAPVPGPPLPGGNVQGTFAFVSLSPGTVANGDSATVRDAATGTTVTVPVIDGGFDPVK